MNQKITALKKEFPTLEEKFDGRKLVYLYSACTVLKMNCAALAQSRHMLLLGGCGGKRSMHSLAAAMEEDFFAARSRVAAFMGAASPEEVIFTSGVTDAVNLLALPSGGFTSPIGIMVGQAQSSPFSVDRLTPADLGL